MSRIIFLQCFQDQRSAGIPREAVRQAFAPFLTELESDLWSVHYDPENSCTLFLEPFDAETIHQMTVRQPCEDLRLWDSLAVVLGLGNVILYFPGLLRPLIREEAAEAHIPSALLQTLGIPLGVCNGHELRAAIESP